MGFWNCLYFGVFYYRVFHYSWVVVIAVRVFVYIPVIFYEDWRVTEGKVYGRECTWGWIKGDSEISDCGHINYCYWGFFYGLASFFEILLPYIMFCWFSSVEMVKGIVILSCLAFSHLCGHGEGYIVSKWRRLCERLLRLQSLASGYWCWLYFSEHFSKLGLILNSKLLVQYHECTSFIFGLSLVFLRFLGGIWR